MYADEADRFRRDAAAEMRQQKVEAWTRQQVGLSATAPGRAGHARLTAASGAGLTNPEACC
jgi:hypothetical protein